MALIKLGELLVKANVLRDTQLKQALNEQQKWGGKLGDILVRMQFLTEEVLVKALAKQLGIPAVSLDSVQSIPGHVRDKVPSHVARNLNVVPLQVRDDGKTLVVAMAEPQNLALVDELRAVTRCRIVTQVAGRSAVARAFTRFYEDELDDMSLGTGSFKVVDAQGNTVVKSQSDIAAQKAEAVSVQRLEPASQAPRSARTGEAAMPAGDDPEEQLRQLEQAQRQEVASLKAMIELLIERGVFSREEYLARLKR